MLVWGILICAEGMWAAIVSSTIQDLDHGGIPVLMIIWHVIQTFVLIPVFRFMEACIVFDAILFPSKTFHVVSKI